MKSIKGDKMRQFDFYIIDGIGHATKDKILELMETKGGIYPVYSEFEFQSMVYNKQLKPVTIKKSLKIKKSEV